MQHVVITGGAGFIGSHLTERFLSENYKVSVIDNLITGSMKNVTMFKNNKNYRFYECDVSEKIPNLEFGKSDIVLHFACPASPVDFEKIPLEIMKVDSYGTFHTLELAKADKARFLIASTSEVYGDPLVHPQTEEYWGNVNPIGLRSCYDEVKRFSEALTFVYHRKYQVNTGIVRIFNTYGPRMRLDDGRVVPNLCGQALRNEPLTVYGPGTQTRSFCYVDDLVEGIFRLTLSQIHEPVNMGNPVEYKIIEFAQQVLKAIPNSRSKIIYKPLLHADDPKQRKPVIERAKKHFSWEPKVKLEEGILKTIEYFRSEIESGR